MITAPAIERPILMSGPLVRATLGDWKTQTRRGSGLELINARADAWTLAQHGAALGRYAAIFEDDAGHRHTAWCPYGQAGDRLWVRETWAYVGPGSGSDLPDYVEERKLPENHHTRNCWYAADGTHRTRWTPSIHMPKWACRLRLELLDIRAERVQAITEADALAEGVVFDPDPLAGVDYWIPFDGDPPGGQAGYQTAREAFAAIWDKVNGPPRPSWYRWSANPWVWVLTFRRVIP